MSAATHRGVGGWGDSVGAALSAGLENSALRLNPPASRPAPGRPAQAESPRRFDTEPSSRVSRSVLSYMRRSTNPCGCSHPSPITKQTIQPFLPSLQGRVCKRPPTNPSVRSQPRPKANQKTPFWHPPEFHPSTCAKRHSNTSLAVRALAPERLYFGACSSSLHCAPQLTSSDLCSAMRPGAILMAEGPYPRRARCNLKPQVAYLMSSCQGSVRWSGSMARAR